MRYHDSHRDACACRADHVRILFCVCAASESVYVLVEGEKRYLRGMCIMIKQVAAMESA